MTRPKMRRDRPRRHSPGFTLLELLIAVTLLAVLSVLLMGGLRLGTRVWERSAASVEETDEFSIARGFLQASLGNAYPLLDRSDPTRPLLLFTGEAKALHYLSPMPQALGAAGMAHVDLRLERAEGAALRLVLDLRRELAAADAKPLPASVLIDGIEDLEIAYYGSDARNKAAAWQDHWQSSVALPTLVRIRVAFPPGDGRSWPELVVAPRISVEATCSYDPLTRDCRGR